MRRVLPLLAAAALVAVPSAARAESATGKGPDGQTVTVSAATVTDGQTVTVTGSGFDTRKGIYVAFCKDLGEGQVPTPCGGGADTSGLGGGSQWISSNPPPYGRELAVKYGEGGSFEVRISVAAKIGEDVDCTRDACAVVTRADHTRTQDRTQDVRVPVRFAASSSAGEGSDAVLYTGIGVAAVAFAAGGGFLLVRRRKAAA
ncbi:LPXTG cell wall anchor domain-containing protein [Actinocorallia sp. API 0066]|uniref:LPXTG cell wall anchor domain-containing protein n=1 Tax=Actinocorallia sp. API 0066 TaxID=2896846 RepID=UPI001E56A122|nr:LPXTG cell wall anchor domain-containing protein [Actinocorallia sp. API 0066]MCD0449017.1 LPXTG cell wall anchor domain-containing protein [Actinocorallia sp. API 0066]